MKKIIFGVIASVGWASSAFAGNVTLKVATIAPEGTTWMKEMRGAADNINKQTAGRVTFKFYPGGVMGNDDAVLRKIRVNQLQGGAFTSGALADVYPDIQIYSQPFIFNNYNEVNAVRTKMDAQLAAGLEKAGFVALGISDGGFSYVMSSKTITTPDDARKAKVWLPQGDMVSEIAMGAANIPAVSLNTTDVYASLQTGLIDTVGTTSTAAIALQWSTKLKTLTDMPLIYLIGVLAIDDGAFKKIDEADQVIVRKVMAEAFKRIDSGNRQDNQNARAALEKKGIQVIKLDAATAAKWREVGDKANAKLRPKFTPAVLTTFQQTLAGARK